MGSKSIAHGAKGRMGYWLLGHAGERNNFFGKNQLVGQKYLACVAGVERGKGIACHAG